MEDFKDRQKKEMVILENFPLNTVDSSMMKKTAADSMTKGRNTGSTRDMCD